MSKGALGYPSVNQEQVYEPYFQKSCINYSHSTQTSNNTNNYNQGFQSSFTEMRNHGNGLEDFEYAQGEQYNRFRNQSQRGGGRGAWSSDVESPKLVQALMTMMSEYETKEQQNRKKIFISNLPKQMSDFEIKDLFEKNFGTVETACRAKPRFGQLEPFGFVTFLKEEDAKCCWGRRAVFYKGRKIHCSQYVERKKFNNPKKERKFYGGKNGNGWQQAQEFDLNHGNYSSGGTGRLPDTAYYQLRNREYKMGMRIRALDDKPTMKSYWNFLRGTEILSHNLKRASGNKQANVRLNWNEDPQQRSSPDRNFLGLLGQY